MCGFWQAVQFRIQPPLAEKSETVRPRGVVDCLHPSGLCRAGVTSMQRGKIVIRGIRTELRKVPTLKDDARQMFSQDERFD